MLWDAELEGCFGESALVFAQEPDNDDRAFAWLAQLRKRRTRWVDVETQLRAFLTAQDASLMHIEQQLARASARLRPWLPR